MSLEINASHLGEFVSGSDISDATPALEEAARALIQGTGAGNDFLGWRDLPVNYNKHEFARIKQAAARIRESADVLIVIGIGGSYLGARAVIEHIGGAYFNDFSSLKVYFAGNNISGDYLNTILKQCEGRRVCLNVVSKSGTTTEPALAFRVFKNMMEARYGKDEAKRRIFVTTDKARGALKNLADNEGYETFVIPDDIGGRYSVLTAVGLLPIAAAGFDIDKLMSGAADARERFNNTSLENNPCNQYALYRNILYKKGRQVEMLVTYEPWFALFLEWWKQLYGESEGKNKKGVLPVSLVCSTDLHSMGQYMQDGLRIMFETVMKFNKPISDATIGAESGDFDGLNYLSGATMSYINDIAAQATILAHTEGGVPCIVIESDGFDEYSTGELIYFFERACGVSAYMLGVNPFNQPGVESYKKNMFALLGKPGFEDLKEQLLNKKN